MSNHDPDDRTRAGLFGDIAAKAKEAVGELVGNEELAEDGRDAQQAIQAREDAIQDDEGPFEP